ncbi:MAG: hypothetical protein ACREVG_18305, partial [Burkholderiales bacterium]
MLGAAPFRQALAPSATMAPMPSSRHPFTVFVAWALAFALAFAPTTASALAKAASREKTELGLGSSRQIASQPVDASREIAPDYDECASEHLLAGERFNADSGLLSRSNVQNVTWTYDARNRITAIEHRKTGAATALALY